MEFIQSIGFLDIIFIAILAISILLGVIRGAVREVLSLFGLGAAIYLAFNFSDMISKEYVSKFFEQERISYIVSFVLIIIATIFVIALFNLFISQLLKASGLSFLNRMLGLLFGALRGGVISSILAMVISFVPGVEQNKWWQESKLAPFFKSVSAKAMGYVPENVTQYVESTKDTITDVTSSNSGSNKRKVKSTANDRKVVDNILQSIDGSLQETKEVEIKLESDQEKAKTEENREQKKAKLILESYQ
ncbi:MAG: CvpA family protein [Gammaproteobacteria bacterium]|nr:CvpA family protein [Gammaproteobacteria bacterium]